MPPDVRYWSFEKGGAKSSPPCFSNRDVVFLVLHRWIGSGE